MKRKEIEFCGNDRTLDANRQESLTFEVYNYVDAIANDVKDFIETDLVYNEWDILEDFETENDLKEFILNHCDCFESATKARIGSYYSDCNKAKAAISHNLDLLEEAYKANDIQFNWDWELADCLIRQHLYLEGVDEAVRMLFEKAKEWEKREAECYDFDDEDDDVEL